jgi:rod shape-determining protein MreC
MLQRYSSLFVGIFLLISSLFILLSNSEGKSINFLHKEVLQVAMPLQKGINTGVKEIINIWSSYIYLVNLKEENDQLKKTIARLKRDNQILYEKALSVDRLRKLLLFKENIDLNLIPARVIGEDPSSLFKTIIIDKGLNDGVKEGAGVIATNGVVGHVISVSNSASKVILIIDHNSAVDAIIQRSRVRGILEGEGGNTCRLKYVPRRNDVKINDIIISSGFDRKFPKGILIGKVIKIENKKYGLFQYVKVFPSVDFAKLEEVFVIPYKS